MHEEQIKKLFLNILLLLFGAILVYIASLGYYHERAVTWSRFSTGIAISGMYALINNTIMLLAGVTMILSIFFSDKFRKRLKENKKLHWLGFLLFMFFGAIQLGGVISN